MPTTTTKTEAQKVTAEMRRLARRGARVGDTATVIADVDRARKAIAGPNYGTPFDAWGR